MNDVLIRIVADGSVVAIALIATVVLVRDIPNRQKFQAYSRILMAGLTAYLAARLIASVYQPTLARPFELLGTHPGAAYLDNPGFPSDHALFAMALVLAVWFETTRRRLALGLLALTIVMCVGRVVALVHSPLDVIGGLVLALTGIVWYDWKKLLNKHHTTSSHKKQR